ncbi:phosphatidylglycerophosphatase A [Pelagibacteraceae bacterium]|nr:phosphatidylglycerophosphatase A [Pelagibacteraceae bacterium]MDC0339736.1 phosphatidylglycerophosphatase A [Pelagibacteraceae bacterium]MDC0366752.1 phosphatidylglycerophosphatase A [Pelagibacteraceae bacterium]|tara:strand:- start:208 stop:714 length:507 start_codon:yes stop_codon:yes gene_type:complete
MIKYFNTFFVTCFGMGKVKFAPGTLTSLVTAILLFYAFHIVNLSNQLILIILVLIFLYSFFAVAEYIKSNQDKDPKEVVIDEVIGQSIPIYLYEISHGVTKNSEESILFYLYIFILFRYFDIKKPFPVSYFDNKFKNSLGVILDDVVAGLYVVLTLIIFMVIKSKFFS